MSVSYNTYAVGHYDYDGDNPGVKWLDLRTAVSKQEACDSVVEDHFLNDSPLLHVFAIKVTTYTYVDGKNAGKLI